MDFCVNYIIVHVLFKKFSFLLEVLITLAGKRLSKDKLFNDIKRTFVYMNFETVMIFLTSL